MTFAWLVCSYCRGDYVAENTLDLFYKIITSTVDVFCIVKGTVDAHVQSWQWFAGGVTFALELVAAGTLLTRWFLYRNPETVLRSVLYTEASC